MGRMLQPFSPLTVDPSRRPELLTLCPSAASEGLHIQSFVHLAWHHSSCIVAQVHVASLQRRACRLRVPALKTAVRIAIPIGSAVDPSSGGGATRLTPLAITAHFSPTWFLFSNTRMLMSPTLVGQ